jgi:hypothetical protein
MKNKWKIAFWACFVLLIATALFELYSILDQGVTITHMRGGYSDKEADLETLIEIIESTDQTKGQIETKLKDHRLYHFMDFDKDTVALERVTLIFKDYRLEKIEKQW